MSGADPELVALRRVRDRIDREYDRPLDVPGLAGRVASSGRKLILHLPKDWAWAPAWEAVFDGATGPPVAHTA